MSADLPALRHISLSDLRPDDAPTPKIRSDEDVEAWKFTRGYQDYGLFLRRLCESVVGYTLPFLDPSLSEATVSMRFGNLAFRTWGKRLESQATALLHTLLPPPLHAAVPFLTPYLVTGFGSPIRMDYGTGHEASFALLLSASPLSAFLPRSLRQSASSCYVSSLEPAGSHGVWGLDDYSFLTYVFGSAQLRDQTEIPVSAVLQRPLPPTNLYFMSIMRILEVKQGPFHEHSSQLYSIAIGVATWSKVNSGLFKMYEAEVLGKRVVVQHIPLGGLLDWDVPHEHTQTYTQAHAHAPTHAYAPTTFAPPSLPSLYATSSTHRSLPGTPTRHPTAAAHLSSVPPRSLNASPFHGNHSHAHQRGPIVPGRMPLGPTASTSLRPLSDMGPPPPPAPRR
ncbi:Serine/threonine-protein phosphatase 2A activator 1 [Grifola frondosa]|uniref:Serine/threonine-protein phosphatase 2A activator n=1 Tax=Grifola frondosa TaxID=5627 RepID=A0A1C7M6M0_GRIFR|nr:Serine/threonine-protein phosphatase 2A activator 1 [Grifola frondosa]